MTGSTDPITAAWLRCYAPGRRDGALLGMAPAQGEKRRAEADRRAAWRRWHVPALLQGFNAEQQPWFALLERARVETLAARGLRGMARNLGALEALAPANVTAEAVYRAARAVFAGQAASTAILPSPPAPASRGWWRWRGQRQPHPHPHPHPQAATPLDDAALCVGLQAAVAWLDAPETFAHGVRPLVAGLAALARGAASREAELPEAEGASTPPMATASEADELPETPEQVLEQRLFPAYRVHTRRWDEEYPARHYLQPEDTQALQRLLLPDRQRVRALAHRLQRRLQAVQLRRWHFDQEEGVLDARRLSRLLTPAGSQAVFRVEDAATVPEACVTLLVDQSGSMDARRRLMATLAIDLAVHSLTLCRIRCEVLGYTTCFGEDNPIARQWKLQGAAAEAGRLNALRHIIYKHAEQPWRQARGQLGLMLRESFGQENIDGEALFWAANRLLRRREPRKLLIVLSDGAPYDRATADANGRGYLADHLRQVIAKVEASPVQLLAIGTGQDVSRYYRHACVVRQPEQVPEVLFKQLGELLTATFGSKDRP